MKKVHAWNIKGYVKLDKFMKNLVRKNLREIHGSLRKAEIKMGLSDYHHRKLDKKYTRTDILFNKIAKHAKIDWFLIEKHIVSWKDTMNQESKGGVFNKIKFPLILNPEYIRLVSHIIGDGNLQNNLDYISMEWCQNDTTNLRLLIKRLFNKDSLNKNKKRVSIPSLPLKVVCSALNINYGSVTKEEILKKSLNLPKEHKVQVLAAVIEDEGSAGKNQLIVRMSNKKIIELVKRIVNSLGYEGTILRKYYYFSKYHHKKVPIWHFNLNISGIQKFNKDLLEAEKKSSYILNLWEKKKAVQELATHKSILKGRKRNRVIRNAIMNKSFKKLSFSRIKEEYNLSSNKTMSLLRYMKNNKDIIKTNKGEYKINNENS